MTTLAVGIITYKRPDSLKRLLAGIATQTFTDREAIPFTVVIVDNDAAGSARSVCDEARSELKLEISYIIEPQKGVPFARNRILASLPDNCELLAWIDDDEAPTPNWLDALTLTQKETEADIVMGAISAILPENAPVWVKNGGFFNRRRFIDRASLAEGATNNCLVNVRSIKSAGLRFNEKLRYPGGSDTLFFREAARKNLRMVWSAAAVVQDFVQPEHCKLGWLLRRHFSAGITLAACDVETDGIKGWFTRLYYGFSKLFQGLINLPIGFEGQHELVRALLALSRGSGMIAGLLGVRKTA